jgi:hypothetical protein
LAFTVHTRRTSEALIFFCFQSNPLIPSNISSTCQAFFIKLNTDSDLAQCIAPLVKAATSGSGTSALGSVCSTTPCNATVTGKLLVEFQQSCQDELVTTPNKGVILFYDALYIASPLQKALCEKDSTSGSYCVSKYSSPSTKRSSPYRRGQQVALPDVATWNNKFVAFLGINPKLSADKLCTPCTRQVISDYTLVLGEYPYSPGLSNSVLLADEQSVYSAVTSECGASFLNGEVQAAGGLATSAAPRSADGGFVFVGSAIAAAAAGAAALL